MKEFDYDLDYKSLDFSDEETRKLYRIGRGEQGVLLVRPHTNDICAHWRRYAIYKKYVYEDGEFDWNVEDMGESSPDRYCYKNGKIEEGWSTPMEDEE